MEKHYNHIYESCKEHMHAYVLIEMNDGTTFDGIITGVDDEQVYVAVPAGDDTSLNFQLDSQRQYGYGSPSYGYGSYGYGYPRPRFRRLILPLTFIAALSLLPWY